VIFGLASERAKFGFPEINVGIFPGGGATQRLPEVIWRRLGKRVNWYTGRMN